MTALPAAISFHEEIRERASAIEAERRMPADLAARMAQQGMFRLLVPAEYGGLQVHPRTFFETLEQTARSDGSVGWVLMIGATTGIMSASLPEPWAQKLYAAKPHVITSGVTYWPGGSRRRWHARHWPLAFWQWQPGLGLDLRWVYRDRKRRTKAQCSRHAGNPAGFFCGQ